MIEQIIGTLKSEVGEKLAKETEVPSEKMDGIFSVLGDVVKGTATKEMLGGNHSGLMNLFSDTPNDASANQIQSKMGTDVVSELIGKLGISPTQAKSIAAIALPALIGMITKKKSASSKDDSSVLTDIFGGMNKGGLGGMAKDLLGGFLK